MGRNAKGGIGGVYTVFHLDLSGHKLCTCHVETHKKVDRLLMNLSPCRSQTKLR